MEAKDCQGLARDSKKGRLVAHRGFEPLISALRGRCPGPLDECATPTTGLRPVSNQQTQYIRTGIVCKPFLRGRFQRSPNLGSTVPFHVFLPAQSRSPKHRGLLGAKEPCLELRVFRNSLMNKFYNQRTIGLISSGNELVLMLYYVSYKLARYSTISEQEPAGKT